MLWREHSGGDRPDVRKALVHKRGQLSIRVIGATCRFWELAQPVSFDPLDVSARLCDVKKISASAHLLRSKAMGFHELSIPFRFSIITWTFSSFAIVMKKRRCTMSYFSFNSSGSGLKMSSLVNVVFGPYQDSGGYCKSEMSKPSNFVEEGNSRVNSPSQIL